MNPELNEQLRTIHHVPLQALSVLLLRIKFRWCPVGWTDWQLRRTKDNQTYFKLQAGAPIKAKRKTSYWPTPMASPYELVHVKKFRKQVMLSNALAMDDPSLEGQAINPAWVEIKMGFPEGWTDLQNELSGSALVEGREIA